MKNVYLTLNWFFGLGFLVQGLASFSDGILPAILAIAISMLLLPPVRNFFHSKTNKEMSVRARTLSILVLFIAFTLATPLTQDENAQEVAIQEAREAKQARELSKQNTVDDFNANRVQILSEASTALTEERYEEVMSSTEKYVITDDAELMALRTQAQAALNTKRREQILAELKIIPTDAYKRNQDLYKELVALSPNEEAYSKKLAFYEQKHAEKLNRERAQAKRKKKEAERTAARKTKIESQFSKWDGSHPGLERVIKASMNDPDSYDHVKTEYWDLDDRLVVKTTFRGKNAFGGVVKNSVKAKVSLDGQVLEIMDQY